MIIDSSAIVAMASIICAATMATTACMAKREMTGCMVTKGTTPSTAATTTSLTAVLEHW